jgi:hypothetical protein
MRNELPRIHDGIQINIGFYIQTLQQVQHIFRRDITGSAFGIRTATQTCDRRMKNTHANFECRIDIGQRLSVGVMKMPGQLMMGNSFATRSNTLMHPNRRTDTNRIGHINFVTADIAQSHRDISDRI